MPVYYTSFYSDGFGSMNYFQACVMSSNFSAQSFLVLFSQYQVVSSHTCTNQCSVQDSTGPSGDLLNSVLSVASKNSRLYLLCASQSPRSVWVTSSLHYSLETASRQQASASQAHLEFLLSGSESTTAYRLLIQNHYLNVFWVPVLGERVNLITIVLF